MTSKGTVNAAPQVGQLLWRGCSCDEFARVLRVGKDANRRDVIDVELVDGGVADLLPVRGPDDDAFPNLMYVELPPGTKVIVRDVPWKLGPGGSNGGALCIECEFNFTGCYRCNALFYPHDEGKEVFQWTAR